MRHAFIFGGVLFSLLLSGQALAQTYPAKPIRMISAFSPGGPTDLLGRPVGQKLYEAMGQPVIIDYKPGGNAIIGTDYVAKAAADGYTLLLIAPSQIINPSTQKFLPFDMLKDFTGLSPLAHGDVVLVSNPKLPFKSVKELVALAKSRPGMLNYGSTGTGSTVHLGGELFKIMAGVDIMHVPFKGGGPALAALVAGTVDVAFVGAPPAAAHIKSGNVRLLAVTSLKRSESFPDAPTVVEAGYSNFAIGSDYGILAPAATPRAAINRLNGALQKILAAPEIKTLFAGLGVQSWWDTPEHYTTWFAEEVAKWDTVAKTIKYVPE